jgi:phosphate uptake regulator
MFQDALTALKANDTFLAQDIINRDNEVDKLQWLIYRQFHFVLHDPNLLEKMQVNMNQALNFLVVSRILERVGDHGVRIASHLPNIIDRSIEPAVIADINLQPNLAMQILDSSMPIMSSASMLSRPRSLKKPGIGLDLLRGNLKLLNKICSY